MEHNGASVSRRSRLFVPALAALSLAFVFGWWWRFVQLDRPCLRERYHLLAFDVAGKFFFESHDDLMPARPARGEHPLVAMAAAIARRFGVSYPSLLAYQLPLLALLLAAISLVALRLGGWEAAAVAAWTGAVSPATLGCALEFNDLLAMQALVAAAVALVAWSDARRAWPLALFAALPMMAVFCVAWVPSNAVAAWAVFTVASVAFLAGRVRRSAGSAGGDQPSLAILAAWSTGYLLLCWFAVPTTLTYIVGYGADELRTGAAAWGIRPIEVLLAYPLQWALLQVGPWLATASAVAAVAILVRRTSQPVAWPLIWLFGSLLVLGLSPKRNEYYAITAVPATYVIVGVALARWRGRAVRIAKALALGAAVALFAAGWYAPARASSTLGARGWPAVEFLLARRSTVTFGFHGAPDDPLLPYAVTLPTEDDPTDSMAQAIGARCTSGGRPLIVGGRFGADQSADFLIWYRNRDARFERFDRVAPDMSPTTCVLTIEHPASPAQLSASGLPAVASANELPDALVATHRRVAASRGYALWEPRQDPS